MIEFGIGEDNLALHALLELVPCVPARLKLLVVLLQVFLVEARRALLLHILLSFISACFVQIILTRCLFVPWLQGRGAQLELDFLCDVLDRLLPPACLSLVLEQLLSHRVRHVLPHVVMIRAQLPHESVVVPLEVRLFIHTIISEQRCTRAHS